MRSLMGALLSTAAILSLCAEEPLPQPEENEPLEVEPLEIEPPVLIHSRGPDGLPNVPAPPEKIELTKLEAELVKAKKRAASGEGLFRAGIIAKVDAEERTLKVFRLEAKLAEARLEEAKSVSAAGENIAEAAATAERAIKERQRAELEAALRNLQRQQKLLALGSGRRADVNRAEKKLAELQGGGN